MIKRFLSLSFILTLVLTSCDTPMPTSPDISGDVGDMIIVSPTELPNISPSPPLPSNPSLTSPSEPSPSVILPIDRMHIRVITGTYTEDIVHHDQSIIYTDWNDSSFGWSRNTTPFYYNDIIMGALSDFANVFSFEIILLDETTYSIINDKGDELILSNDSYIAQFNGQTKNLTYPTIHKFSLNSSDGVLFIPLQLIAELMGLYTYENTNDGYNNHCLWLSECSILNGDEFIPNDNYLSLGMTTEPSYTDGLVNFNEYDLKEDGCTYSGIRIGDSYDEVISILGAPQTQKIQNDITGGINEQIYYDLNPDANYDYPDYIGFYFSDGVLEEVLLRIYIWDN